MASVPIRTERAQAFQMALAERLGLDPQRITSAGFSWEIVVGEADARIAWEGVAALPAQELLDMLNAARL